MDQRKHLPYPKKLNTKFFKKTEGFTFSICLPLQENSKILWNVLAIHKHKNQMFFLDVWLLKKIFFNPTSKLFDVVPATTVESKLGRLATGNVIMETAERN